MKLSRRTVLQLSAAAAAGSAVPAMAGEVETKTPAPITALEEDNGSLEPISVAERRERIGRAQALMAQNGLDAVVIASGSSLDYFTGVSWWGSERLFCVVLTREGDPAWVTPAFEKGRALEKIPFGDDVRAWEEHESPHRLVAGILRDRKATGTIGMEETLKFVFSNGVASELPAAKVTSATPVTAGCRQAKDAHELAIMRQANRNTVKAHRAVFQSLKEGMTQNQVSDLSREAHRRLGMSGGSLVLFGPDAAFPHGTKNPRPLQKGDFVLVDGGGKLHGYSSDITRTQIFGAEPTDRQRRIWQVVRRAQDAAFATLRPGVECQAVDAAARKVLEDEGFGPGYRYLTHRLGHGIGLDGHEWTYLVRGNTTKLLPGMTFSNEPGIYIPGEIGVRHEDIVYITEDGGANMTEWSGSPEDAAKV